jgi:hypothetical protein
MGFEIAASTYETTALLSGTNQTAAAGTTDGSGSSGTSTTSGSGDTVSISEEGKRLAIAYGSSANEETESSTKSGSSSSEEDDDTTDIEDQIDEVKEKIEELQKEIEQVEQENLPEDQKQEKLQSLQTQLAQYQAQLTQLQSELYGSGGAGGDLCRGHGLVAHLSGFREGFASGGQGGNFLKKVPSLDPPSKIAMGWRRKGDGRKKTPAAWTFSMRRAECVRNGGRLFRVVGRGLGSSLGRGGIRRLGRLGRGFFLARRALQAEHLPLRRRRAVMIVHEQALGRTVVHADGAVDAGERIALPGAGLGITVMHWDGHFTWQVLQKMQSSMRLSSRPR